MIEEFLIRLHNGELDDRLAEIDQGVAARRKILRGVRVAGIQVDSRVRLTSLSPKYLNGRRGTVVGRSGGDGSKDRWIVIIDAEDRNRGGKGSRYINQNTGRVLVPLACLELDTEETG